MPKQTKPPADPDAGPVAQFGYELRMLRQKADLSYAAIAANSFYSKSAIWTVDQGHTLPSPRALEAFVGQCGGDTADWVSRRAVLAEQLSAARKAQDKPIPRHLGVLPPDPTAATTVAEYIDLIKGLREWAGMTYRQIAEATRDHDRRVAASTFCGALKRGTLPARDLVESFLRALELNEATQALWLEVWQTLADEKPVRPNAIRRRLRHLDQQDDSAAVTGHSPAVPAVRPKPKREETRVPYPIFEVRDWVFVNGHWQATKPSRPSPSPLLLRFVPRSSLAQEHRAALVGVLGLLCLIATVAALLLSIVD